MKELVSVAPTLKIKWKGIFDAKELFRNIKLWLEYQGYGDETKNFYESQYVERVKGDSKQVEAVWVCQKDKGEYFAYLIEIKFRILELRDIETEIKGRKIKTQTGEVTIEISGKLVKDRKNKWNSSLMQNFYDNYVVKDRFDANKIDLYEKIYNLHDEIKTYLSM